MSGGRAEEPARLAGPRARPSRAPDARSGIVPATLRPEDLELLPLLGVGEHLETGIPVGGVVLDLELRIVEGLHRCEAGPDPSPELVVDLSQVTFLDSTGIRDLIVAEQALAHRGGRLVICGAHGVVRRCLEITGVLERFGGASTNGTEP